MPSDDRFEFERRSPNGDDLTFEFVENQRPCSYLPEETASLQYRVAMLLAPERYGELLRRGWRRHGMMLFRPQCPRCVQCRSLRIPVREFRPSKSQRRILKANSAVDVRIGPARVTPEHIDLYNAYHADMSQRRGWREQSVTEEEYEAAFLAGNHPFAREMQYRLDGRLIGLGLVDVLPQGLSSIYFFHDPAVRKSAPGVFSILCELELCRREQIDWLYLGYWIQRCDSMAYKADYRPHELLARYVEEDEEPEWKTAD